MATIALEPKIRTAEQNLMSYSRLPSFDRHEKCFFRLLIS